MSSSVASRASDPDGATKLLVTLADGEAVEAVMIPADRRLTACVSTQVGCRMGCAFCASRGVPFVRNLAFHEMVEQALLVKRESGGNLTHVVFMGVGEPLDNLAETLRAIERLNAPWALGIGMRRITISTVGIRGKIRE